MKSKKPTKAKPTKATKKAKPPKAKPTKAKPKAAKKPAPGKRRTSTDDASRSTSRDTSPKPRKAKPAKKPKAKASPRAPRDTSAPKPRKPSIPTTEAGARAELRARRALLKDELARVRLWQQWVHDHPAWVAERAKAHAAREERALRARERAILRDLRDLERLMGRPLTDDDVRRELSREHVSYAGALLDDDGDGELVALTPAVRASNDEP